MNRHVVVAALIGSVAIIIAAWIVNAGMTNLGRSIERAGPYGRSSPATHVPSAFRVSLEPSSSSGSPFRVILNNGGQNQPFKVDVQEQK